MDTYLPYVGFVQFPRNPRDLTSEVCPACLAERQGTTCSSCGLNLASPLVAQLDAASASASSVLAGRLEILGQIRFDSEHDTAVPSVIATTVTAPTVPPVMMPDPVPPSGSLPAAAIPAPTSALPRLEAPDIPSTAGASPASPAAPAAPKRHLGVQVILLIVGVSLLSVGAIFFLVYAFITFGLVWRSVIIVAVTVAAMVGATLLRKRRLTVTAEAISALGIVFVYLDVFAVRANDLFGAGDTNGLVYWGIALLASAVGFAAWHRFSGLRLPNIVAFVSVAPALALIVGGVTDGLDGPLRFLSSMVALAVGGLIHPLSRYQAEKIISSSFGIAGLLIAAITSPLIVGDDWVPAIGLSIVAAVAGAQVFVVARVGSPAIAGRLAAAIGAAALSSATLFVAFRVNEPGFLAFWPVVVAAILALLLEFLSRARSTGLTGTFAGIATRTTAVVGIVILVIPAVYAFIPTVTLATAVPPRWAVPGGSLIPIQPENAVAIVALAVALALVSIAWAVSGTLNERRLVVLSAAAAIVVLAIPMLGVLWAAVLGWLLVAVAGVVALGVARARSWSSGIRIIVFAMSVIALALAYFSSWASIDTWWYGSVGAVAILVASRAVTANTIIRASTLGVAIVLALVAAAAEGSHVNERFAGGTGSWMESVHTVAILATVLLAGSALLSRVISEWETRVLFWISLVVAVSAGAISWFTPDQAATLVLPATVTSLFLGLGLVAALGLWTVIRSGPAFTVERVATSIVLAPAGAWALDSASRVAGLTGFVTACTPAIAALLVSAAALSIALTRQETRLRLPLEAGVAIVAVPSLLASLASDATWLVFIITAATLLIASVSPDGLFCSTSPRKNVGWLAVALGAGSLWWALQDRGEGGVELYVLPLAGLLLIIAMLDWRAARARAKTSAAAPFIALAGLLVAIVPIAVVSMDGPTVRTIIIAVVSAVLLLAASLATRTGSLRPYLDVAALSGAIGLTVAGFGRPIVIALVPRPDDVQLDVWVAATFIILIAAAVIQARVSDESTHRHRLDAGVVVTIMALAAIVTIELPVLSVEGLGSVRAAVLLAVLLLYFVVGLLVNRAPATWIVGWIALAAAVLVAIVAVSVRAIDPFEWSSAAIAAALLCVGALRLRSQPSYGSWPWLAPGILVLMLPTLLATFTDAPIWRLVGLGVVSVACIIVGALAKLQAPLILGAVVALVHAVRTFAPQLVAVYQLTEWWVWAVIGGAIILFIALTLEKRVRDLKAVSSTVSALR